MSEQEERARKLAYELRAIADEVAQLGGVTEEKKPIEQVLIEARSKRRWSQAKLAEESGVSTNTIIKIESGKGNPRLSTLMTIANVLDIPYSMLEDEG